MSLVRVRPGGSATIPPPISSPAPWRRRRRSQRIGGPKPWPGPPGCRALRRTGCGAPSGRSRTGTRPSSSSPTRSSSGRYTTLGTTSPAGASPGAVHRQDARDPGAGAGPADGADAPGAARAPETELRPPRHVLAVHGARRGGGPSDRSLLAAAPGGRASGFPGRHRRGGTAGTGGARGPG